MMSQILACDQANDGYGPLDSQDGFNQAHQGHDHSDESRSGPDSDTTDCVTTSTAVKDATAPTYLMAFTASMLATLPLNTSSATPNTSLVGPIPSCHSVSPASMRSLSSSFSSPPFPTSTDSSPFVSDDNTMSEEQMYVPKEAKEISIQTDGYCAVRKRGVDSKDEDEEDDCPEGMSLEGYRKGQPVYYVTAGYEAFRLHHPPEVRS